MTLNEAVFPAYAGVFPTMSRLRSTMKSLPRIRGGVSSGAAGTAAPVRSSPHTRGCFQ